MDFLWTFIALWVGLPLLVVVIVVAIAVTGRRRRGPRLSRAETLCAALVGAGALLVAGVSAAGVVGSFVQVFAAEPSMVHGFAIGNAATPEFTGKADAIVAGGYESVWLEVADVPGSARWMLALAAALPSLASTAIGVVIVWLSIALLRARPFARRLPLGIGIAAIAVMVGGMGSQVAAAASRGLIVEYLDPMSITAGGNAEDGSYEVLMGFMLNLDPASIGWAFALALAAAAFQIGTRLQRDTEGLV